MFKPGRLPVVSIAVFCCCLATGLAHAKKIREDFAPGITPGAEGCQLLFADDDQALFQFVDTRSKLDYSQYAGMNIRSIRYLILPIFNEQNPDEDIWVYRALNRLHIDTRPSTLYRQMIIRPGEALDPETLYENERLLRQNNYLVDAMIVPQWVCADGVSLLVVVRDIWTFSPEANASRSGGSNKTGARLVENNLLGSGHKLTLEYFHDVDRSGSGFSYTAPQLFGHHAELKLDYLDTSDGEVIGTSLVKPFYHLDSHWSAGVSSYYESLTNTVELNDVVINEYVHESDKKEVFIGWSAGRKNRRVYRWRLGFRDEEDEFTATDELTSAPPPYQRLVYPWIGWEKLEDKYWTASNITRSNRQEDILLGQHFIVQLGMADESFGSTSNRLMYQAEGGYTASFGEHHLVRLKTWVDGQHDLDYHRPEQTLYGSEMTWYNFVDPLNRWYASARFNGGRNLRADQLLTSGGNESLPGYPSDIQRGNRQWLATIERRRFTNIHLLNLAWLGGAAYIDAGQTWNTEAIDPDMNDHVLYDAGFGLRLSPSKFRIDRVLHLDIAWPLTQTDNIDSYQIIVAGTVDF